MRGRGRGGITVWKLSKLLVPVPCLLSWRTGILPCQDPEKPETPGPGLARKKTDLLLHSVYTAVLTRKMAWLFVQVGLLALSMAGFSAGLPISMTDKRVVVQQAAHEAAKGMLLQDVNILQLTDVHSWLSGHVHEAGIGADYADCLSFYMHLKTMADAAGKDLWLFDRFAKIPLFPLESRILAESMRGRRG